MFENLKDRFSWEAIISDPFTPPYMKDVIRNVLIPYGISSKKYLVNKECIDNCCERSHSGKVPTQSVLETVRDLNYKFSCIRCSSMPLWYYYAFPDVFLWTISDSPSAKEALKSVEQKYGEDNLLDTRGEVRSELVKMFIDAYLRATRKELECKH